MLISTATAKAHLRKEADYPDDQILPYLGAAESKAMNYLNRKIFSDNAAMAAAVAAAPAALTAAGTEYAAVMETLRTEPDGVARALMQEQAGRKYKSAQADATATLAGIVLNDQLRAAILVILDHYFSQRGETPLPIGSEYLLWDYRVGFGV